MTPKILIVDDEAHLRMLIQQTLEELEDEGVELLTASNGEEALQTIEAERPDALVSDIGLPGEDGFALVRQIRQSEAERGGFLPAIALTGYARAEDRIEILAAGFQAHIPKPVEPVELAAAIAHIAGRVWDSES